MDSLIQLYVFQLTQLMETAYAVPCSKQVVVLSFHFESCIPHYMETTGIIFV